MLTPEQRKTEEGLASAKKRTCPKCGVSFITRREKRIHRDKTRCESVSE